MKETLVTIEVAKLAKECGFNWGVNNVYNQNGNFTYFGLDKYDENNTDYNLISAPTQSLLQKWLREEKNIVVHINYDCRKTNFKGLWRWGYTVYFENGQIESNGIETYEGALKEGLLTALKHMKNANNNTNT